MKILTVFHLLDFPEYTLISYMFIHETDLGSSQNDWIVLFARQHAAMTSGKDILV